MLKRPKIAVIMGSKSDLLTMNETTKILKDFNIPYEVKILSAHRSPDEVTKFAKAARRNGFKVIIAGAGGAAALAGVVASHTTLPVIGVPMETNELKGIDSLFSTVQMPSGIPVATVTIGKAGAKNAAFLALEILSLCDKRLEKRLVKFKNSLAGSIRKNIKSRCVL